MTLKPYSILQNEWSKLIAKSGKPVYALSLTFRYEQSISTAKRHTNFLLHLLNQRLFSRKYKQHNEYLKGFAFLEPHASGAPHVHLLIYFSRKFYIAGKPSFEDHFSEMIKKMRTMTSTGTKLRKVYYSPGAIGYPLKMLKTMDDSTHIDWHAMVKDTSFIGIFGKEGVAWGS